MNDVIKILAWIIICLCIITLSVRIYNLQKDVKQLQEIIKIEQVAE